MEDLEDKWLLFRRRPHNEGIAFIVYVIEELYRDSEHFIKAWTLYSEVSPRTNRWDYTDVDWNNVSEEWAKVTIKLTGSNYDYEEIEPNPANHQIMRRFEENPPTNSLYRVAQDVHVTYGGSGQSDLVYPIWVNEKLNFPEEKRLKLLRLLLRLNDERKDFQEGSPIQDIIDPELFPYIMGYSQGKTWLDTLHNSYKKHAGYYRTEIQNLKWNLIGVGEEFINTPQSESVQLRYSYHWIPSEFSIDATGKVSQITPIHNLPRTQENLPLYNLIGMAFNEMVPMFEKIGVVTSGIPTNLQVIVKAQSYNLPPFSSYAGRWHIEGATENIVAVGVYYIQIEDELQGGKLKFRPDHGPGDFYIEMARPYVESLDVEVETPSGSCVVFSNILPHRCRKIRNNTDHELRRTFLTFFVVDPSNPLQYSTALAMIGKRELSIYLAKSAREQTGGKHLDQYVINYIFEFLKFAPQSKQPLRTLEQAKEFRTKSRRAKVLQKSGWGYIQYGNCGTVEFGDNEFLFRESHPMSHREPLHHTDSA
eukprot:TRINITY_DN2106_c0_g2_i6.p1 TRINITY_DN2106_c0_g2~~TRINITY_DN2106_c0_g2_i6.p1  ORF type:complete len:598 (-),score=89.97 TRINITY_DN2106_c0_g2_i6:53-1654(-)